MDRESVYFCRTIDAGRLINSDRFDETFRAVLLQLEVQCRRALIASTTTTQPICPIERLEVRLSVTKLPALNQEGLIDDSSDDERTYRLKPCPFCGETPTLETELTEHDYGNGLHVVYLVHHCFSGLEVVTESRCWEPNATSCNNREHAIGQCIDDWNKRKED